MFGVSVERFYYAAMSHRFTLSRVAVLLGKSRSELQRMIRAGELQTFDGSVEMDELLRVFPDIRWQDDGEYARVEEIKRRAFGKRVMERVLPEKEVLAERLYELGKEYAASRALLLHQARVLAALEQQFSQQAWHGGDTVAAAIQTLRTWLRSQLESPPPDSERAQALLAKERLMRVMSAQVTLKPSGHEFFVEGSDTLLEAALRSGMPLRYGCSNGNCGECKSRLVSGQITKVHPHDFSLTERERGEGYFLMCSNAPVTDVVIEAGEASPDSLPQQEIDARVHNIEVIDANLRIVHLLTPRSQRLQFLAGQRVIARFEGCEGEYPVASCPCEERHIELHVPRDNRAFARKVFGDLSKESIVRLTGPEGRMVLDIESTRSQVFIAWNEGFASIKSLLQHAMSIETAERIDLYWAAPQRGHYQDNVCRAWADALDNLYYHPLPADTSPADLIEALQSQNPDWGGSDVYIAAPAAILDALKMAATERGLASGDWNIEVVL